MVFQLVEFGCDFRHAAGVGGNECVDLGLPHLASIAGHGGGFRAKVLGRRTINALDFERVPVHGFRHPGFSQGAIAAHLPHLADALDLRGTELPVVEIANLRF
jgi:hypothetical protein